MVDKASIESLPVDFQPVGEETWQLGFLMIKWAKNDGTLFQMIVSGVNMVGADL